MTRSLSLLAKLLARVGTRVSIAEVLSDLALFAESVAPETHGSVVLVDPIANTLLATAGPRLGESFYKQCDHQPLTNGFGVCAAAATRRAIVVAHGADAGCYARCRSNGTMTELGACWSAPFYDENGGVTGVFSMYRKVPGEPSRAHIDLLRLIAELAGLIVVRHRDAERLRAQAEAVLRLVERDQPCVSHDLHEAVAAQIAAATLLLAGIAGRLHSSEVGLATDIRRVEVALSSSVATLRQVATSIAPIAPGPFRLTPALRGLALRAQAATELSVQCTVTDALDALLTPQQALQLYRIAEEAVNNVTCHARAQGLVVQLIASKDVLQLEVADDGAGMPRPGESIAGAGLLSMRTRASRLGGTFEVTPREPRGTIVRVCLPLPSPHDTGHPDAETPRARRPVPPS